MLRNIWTSGLLLFAAVMGSTFFITKVWQVIDFPSKESQSDDFRLPSPLLLSVYAGRSHVGCESCLHMSGRLMLTQLVAVHSRKPYPLCACKVCLILRFGIQHHHGGKAKWLVQIFAR